MSKKQKLELTWIGKETRPKLEPRILLEDPADSICGSSAEFMGRFQDMGA